MTATVHAPVRDLVDIRLTDADTVGGKAANLGELISARFPVPPGFVLPAGTYLDAMDAVAIRGDLTALHERALAAAGDPAELDALCGQAATLVRTAGVPHDLATGVRKAYAALSVGGGEDATVAVRSSAVGEDGADASFAGMNATFTNVRGPEDLLRRVVDCWASVFGPRVVAYRAERGMTGEPAIAVVVQVMVAAERAGVAFTAHPTSGRTDVVVIEAALGTPRPLLPT